MQTPTGGISLMHSMEMIAWFLGELVRWSDQEYV